MHQEGKWLTVKVQKGEKEGRGSNKILYQVFGFSKTISI